MTDRPTTWLYAIAPEIPAQSVAELTGVAREPVRLVGNMGLTAVVGSVPRSEFEDPALQRHLEDAAWLESTARAHHEVIAAVARSVDVLPLRFGTLYDDDLGAAELLRLKHDVFTAALARVAGRAEWGVKAHLSSDASAQGADERTDPGDEDAAPRPGTAYLLRRREQLTKSAQARRAAAESAGALHEELRAEACEGVQHPLRGPELTGADGPMLLNGAYLVDRPRAAEFTALVRASAPRYPALRLTLTGPWPPYSFVGDAPSATEGGAE